MQISTFAYYESSLTHNLIQWDLAISNHRWDQTSGLHSAVVRVVDLT